jgi:hypothetical protein
MRADAVAPHADRWEPTAKIVDGALGPHVVSPADAFLERMEETDEPELLGALASRALRRDPACIEAHLAAASLCADRSLAIRHLGAAVTAGEKLWRPVAEARGKDMCWWGWPGTRPYMRALHALGEAHLEQGNSQAARWCFERLLAMNPHDSQGVRFSMEEMAPPPAFVAR